MIVPAYDWKAGRAVVFRSRAAKWDGINPTMVEVSRATSAAPTVEVRSDRHNYALTTRRWAEKLESNRDVVVERWGERTYRLFRVYLWGSSSALARGTLEAYRLVMELPSPIPHRNEMLRLGTVGRSARGVIDRRLHGRSGS